MNHRDEPLEPAYGFTSYDLKSDRIDDWFDLEDELVELVRPIRPPRRYDAVALETDPWEEEP